MVLEYRAGGGIAGAGAHILLWMMYCEGGVRTNKKGRSMTGPFFIHV